MIRSLDALRVFVAVARNQSISGAAKELFVTPGAVSRRMKDLEEELGFPLFERQGRNIALTQRGIQLQHSCQQLFQSLKTTLDTLEQPSDEYAPLVISCEPTITMLWLIPRLPRFYEVHPELSVHVYAAGGPIDFWSTGADIALRRDDFIWDASIYSEAVAPEMIGPVCSGRSSRALHDETEITLLHTRTRPQAWELWRQRTGFRMPASKQLNFEHFYLSLQAARAGLGVAISSIYMTSDQLQNEELYAPFDFVADGSQYHLLAATPIDSDYRKAAFRDWLVAEMKRTADSIPKRDD